MRKCTINATSTQDKTTLWQILTDIASYPQRARYCQRVYNITDIKVGGGFDDVTTILWLPLHMHHQFTRVEVNKALAFDLPLQFGGNMTQTYELVHQDSGINIVITIEFDLRNRLYDMLIGRLLQNKLQKMLVSIVTSLPHATITSSV